MKRVGTKLRRRLRRQWRRQTPLARLTLVVSLALVLAIPVAAVYTSRMLPPVDIATYRPLLHTIAKGESNGNYNAYFGNASNQSIRFTDMTVRQVLDWQASYVQQGGRSSAVGRYQIIRPTLLGLMQESNIDERRRFDAQLQDRLAVSLLERRGVHDFMSQKLSREQFAANLAQEWAALPRVIGGNPNESYYAGDGINQARIPVAAVFAAIQKLGT